MFCKIVIDFNGNLVEARGGISIGIVDTYVEGGGFLVT